MFSAFTKETALSLAAMAEDRAIDATSTVEKPLKITLLGSGWSSSKGGLSTLNRELAIQLSEHANADVSLLVPEGACEFQEIIEAISFGITVVEAKGRAAYDRLDWLSTPPKDHNMEIVVGHGVKLGRQVQFIRDSARFPNCKWVQVVHTAPEDLGRFKSYTEPISKGQRKHQDEVELCKLADLVVPVGPRLKNFYSSYLRRHKTDQDVFTVTPGLFDREFEDLVEKQKPYEDGEFKVLLFGRGDDEDFELKGYNIAAQAFSDPRMKEDFCLMFVGAPQGKVDEVTQRLLQYGIANDHLYVREFIADRERIKDILCEADLAIMPSKSEGFGLVGLEALSAGLPILVGSRSGFAKALEKVPSGKSFIVYSDDPTMWADAIVSVRDKHKSRLDEIKALRESYGQIYSWRSQCKDLAKVMQKMIQGYSHTDVDMTEKDKHNSDTERRMYQDRLYEPCERPMKLRSHQKSESDDGVTTRLSDPDQRSGKTSGRIPMLTSRKGTSNVDVEKTDPDSISEKQLVGFTRRGGPSSLPSRKRTSSASSSEEPSQRFSHSSPVSRTPATTILLRISAQDLDFQQQEIFYDSMRHMLLLTDCLMSDELGLFTGYFTEYYKARVFLQEVTDRGVEIKIECPNMESLASILNHHQCRHLDKLVERCFVTDAIKSVLNLETVTLKTVLEDESRYTEMLGKADIVQIPSKENQEDDASNSTKCIDINPKMTKTTRGLLHKASITGDCNTARALLEIGVDVDQRDQFALTPLHLASWYGHKSVVKLVLNHGADVNALDKFCRTPLQKAERHKYHSIVTLLLESNARQSYQQPVSLQFLAQNAFLTLDKRSGLNMLQAAVFQGDHATVFKAKALLGCSRFVTEMNLKTRGDGDTVFHGKSAIDFLSSLDEKGKDLAKIEKEYLADVEKDLTLIELHRINDGEQAVELVLNNCIDIDTPGLCNRTPLMIASLSSSSAFIETLIDLGADVNAQRTDDKVTPLHLACSWNHYMAVRLLMENGADANIACDGGWSPLHIAASKGNFNVVRLLIDGGSSIDLLTETGRTPLRMAVESKHYMIARLLLDHGADVNIPDIDGYTPFHCAASQGCSLTAELLIEKVSNVNLRTKRGRTPLYIAVKNQHEQLIKMLLEHKADVSMGYSEDTEERIYLVRGTDRGKPAWHYVLVDKHLLGLFLKKTKGGRVDVADFGTVLGGGWGKDPSAGTIDQILKEKSAMFEEIPGESLLHVASRNDDTVAIDLLVKHGVWNLNPRDAEGFTPLHIAAIHGNMQAVEKLVDLGADAGQAEAVADLAQINEEYDIESFLRSKIGCLPERKKREQVKETEQVELDVNRLRNFFREASNIGREVVQLAVESIHRAIT